MTVAPTPEPLPPMTHEERRRLIDTPISFNEIGGHSWGGTCTTDGEGHKRITPNTFSYRKHGEVVEDFDHY